MSKISLHFFFFLFFFPPRLWLQDQSGCSTACVVSDWQAAEAGQLSLRRGERVKILKHSKANGFFVQKFRNLLKSSESIEEGWIPTHCIAFPSMVWAKSSFMFLNWCKLCHRTMLTFSSNYFRASHQMAHLRSHGHLNFGSQVSVLVQLGSWEEELIAWFVTNLRHQNRISVVTMTQTLLPVPLALTLNLKYWTNWLIPQYLWEILWTSPVVCSSLVKLVRLNSMELCFYHYYSGFGFRERFWEILSVFDRYQ